MAERYLRIYTHPETDLYETGSPLLICTGALLKDTQTGRIIAQLKFRNIGAKRIKAVRVSVRAFDPFGTELEGIPEFQYLDLSADRDAEFGQKTAIILPNADTRSFTCACSGVIFADGTVWTTGTEDLKPLIGQKTLSEQFGDLADQYRRDTFKDAKYMPAADRDLWRCACGAINRDDESICHGCGMKRSDLEEAADVEQLKAHDEAYRRQLAEQAEAARIEAERKAEAARIEAERKAEETRKEAERKAEEARIAKEQAAKKRKKTLAIVLPIIAMIAALIILLFTVILPSIRYNKAMEFYNVGQYEEAITAFENLDGYKDSAEKIKVCKTAIKNLFLALDEELFLNYVTKDITLLDQHCEDPTNFGIDETKVPVTLGELTKESKDEWIAYCEESREKLNGINRSLLDDQLQFAYDTYCRYFDMEIESKDWFYNYEPLDEYVGLHMNMQPFFGLYSFKDEKDIENYLTLMADMPRYFGQVLAFEQERANRGFFMTEKMLDVVLEDLRKVAESGETSYLHGTFREAMEKLDFLSDAKRDAYIAKNDELVRTAWVDAYKLLHDGLEELRPKCRARIGAYEQGGAAYEYYCWKMKAEASNNRTVEEEIAFLESCNSTVYTIFLASAMNCYEDLINEKKITTGSLQGNETYLKTLMPKIVPPMPDVEVEYVEVPEELQDIFSPAAYMTPSLDGYRKNIILTNPKDQDHYSMSTLAYVGFPGQVYLFTYQYDLGTIPKFQLMIENNGYVHAWSTNAEWNIAQINEKYGKDLAIATFLNEYFGNILVTIVSLKVNGQGASLKDIEQYLSRWGLDTYAQDFYDYAIDMPIYFFPYTGGFCELFDLTKRCNQGDLVAFFEEYLHWGPSYFDLLNERMEVWATE